MGFVKAPGSLWDKILFINNCQGYPWSWPENKPCTEQAIEGVPRGLVIRESEYKGEVSEKLHFLLADGEEVYCLRSGIDTLFSRGLLLGLRVSLAENATRQIIVSPRISERDEKVIFCNLYAGGQKVRYEWDRDIDCHDLAEELAAKYFPDIPFRKDESSPPPAGGADPATGEVEFKDLIAKNNADLERLQISQADAVNICLTRYGKKSRQLLSDAELIDFVNHIDSLVKKAEGETGSTVTKDDIPF